MYTASCLRAVREMGRINSIAVETYLAMAESRYPLSGVRFT